MIGFLTDWSVRSHYVGVAKAVMKRINPSVEIIDITHEIEPFNVRMASHILLRASKDFPPGSIFVAVVDYGVGTSRKAICMRTKNEQFFVGPDNGIFTHVALEYGVKQVRELNNKKYHYASSYTFHGRDIFAPVAAHLSRGVPFEELGDVLPNFVVLPAKQAEIVNESIVAEIAYFDSFGNVQTNVPIQFAERLEWQMDDVILINETFEATYVRTFGDVPKGALLVHPDSSGFLEIAINQGSAAEKLKLKQGQQITLRRKKA
ncbi:SAM hydrolase/SAM-dependent halogenase family protein [Thermotoga caldifontis]|uniref:SAM hydrolase/SAM-dependent halogenase family protein n=1 Tax=Thermotoga caldifontis TaxID=1508419 RepID=UPI000597DC58|nr:S-adenosyl-l-methionine hydroxide adenosyltransferase family protein [Thermotoga caldifontis]